MTTKTKVFFFIIVGIAGLIVGTIVLLEKMQIFTLPTRGGVNVSLKVAVAPALELWAREASVDFNARNSQITVQVVSLKGLDAARQLDLGKGANLPDAWIAEADFVRQMARSVPYDAAGQSVAKTGLVWLGVTGRPASLPNPDWQTVHAASVENYQFRSAIPSPKNSVEGVAAYLSAMASFYNRAALTDTDLNGDFLAWMEEILVAVPNKTGDPVNQLTSTPPSVDAGLVLESDLSQVDLSRFVQQPPAYNVVFNFPYLIRRGANDNLAADREQAAETFRDFLLSAEQQNRLAADGFMPAYAQPAGQIVQFSGSVAERLRNQYQ